MEAQTNIPQEYVEARNRYNRAREMFRGFGGTSVFCLPAVIASTNTESPGALGYTALTLATLVTGAAIYNGYQMIRQKRRMSQIKAEKDALDAKFE